MKIEISCTDPATLAVTNIGWETLTFDGFYVFSGIRYESRKGEIGNFHELPRHLQKNATAFFDRDKKFKTYKILEAVALSENQKKGEGAIAFYE
ncbi:MAG: hypothetical protein NTV62_01820 [Candidatus Gribaldobacteria bacterium]|nr:hypothetical protein [Candidatus Gribaldobacteria bacterium]